jgi:hypothetical protein
LTDNASTLPPGGSAFTIVFIALQSAPELPVGMASAFTGGQVLAFMLKISILDTTNARRLILEGSLVAPGIEELDSIYGQASEGLSPKSLVVDLKGVTAIGREAEPILLDWMRRGTKFRCSGVLTKHVMRKIARQCRACNASLDSSHLDSSQQDSSKRDSPERESSKQDSSAQFLTDFSNPQEINK